MPKRAKLIEAARKARDKALRERADEFYGQRQELLEDSRGKSRYERRKAHRKANELYHQGREYEHAISGIGPSDVLHAGAEFVLPATVVDAARGRGFHWSSAGLDALTFVPGVGFVARAARAGRGAGRILSAGARATVAPDLSWITRPGDAAAMFGRGYSQGAQTLLRPGVTPISGMARLTDTTRVLAKDMGLSSDIPTMALDDLTKSKVGRARQAVDEATHRAARGDSRPVPIPERPGYYLQIESAPMNRILDDAVYFHTTPDGGYVRIPDDGYTVGLGSEGAKRSQFYAPTAAERFTETAARGGYPTEPTVVVIRDPDAIARISELARDPARADEFKDLIRSVNEGVGLESAGKAYKARRAPTVFESEMVAKYGTQWQKPSQTLRTFDLMGHGGRPINVQVIGKPLTLSQQARLKMEGLTSAITPRRGYKITKGEVPPEGGVADDLRDVYRVGDDAGDNARRVGDDAGDNARRVGDDAGDNARRVGDDAGDNARRVGDDAGDNARRVGDDAGDNARFLDEAEEVLDFGDDARLYRDALDRPVAGVGGIPARGYAGRIRDALADDGRTALTGEYRQRGSGLYVPYGSDDGRRREDQQDDGRQIRDGLDRNGSETPRSETQARTPRDGSDPYVQRSGNDARTATDGRAPTEDTIERVMPNPPGETPDRPVVDDSDGITRTPPPDETGGGTPRTPPPDETGGGTPRTPPPDETGGGTPRTPPPDETGGGTPRTPDKEPPPREDPGLPDLDPMRLPTTDIDRSEKLRATPKRPDVHPEATQRDAEPVGVPRPSADHFPRAIAHAESVEYSYDAETGDYDARLVKASKPVVTAWDTSSPDRVERSVGSWEVSPTPDGVEVAESGRAYELPPDVRERLQELAQQNGGEPVPVTVRVSHDLDTDTTAAEVFADAPRETKRNLNGAQEESPDGTLAGMFTQREQPDEREKDSPTSSETEQEPAARWQEALRQRDAQNGKADVLTGRFQALSQLIKQQMEPQRGGGKRRGASRGRDGLKDPSFKLPQIVIKQEPMDSRRKGGL